MEKQQQLSTDLDQPMVNEPHFDEEWTVLTARPVVPLAELESINRKRTAIKLAGAFAGALLLGALVALASIRLKRDSQAEVVTPSAAELTQSTVAAPVAEATVADAESIPVAETDDTTATESEQNPPVAVAKAPVRVKVAKRNENKSSSEVGREPASLESIAAEVLSQPALVGQWEERRPRRVTFKQRRLQGHAHNRRDLTRIDEIFEGSQHPQPPER